MTTLDRPDDTDLLIALRHPLRRRILRLMADGKKRSPRELAAVLRTPLSNVSYHVRVLAERSVVTLVETQPSRGSVEHVYRGAVEAPWARQVLGLGKDDGAGAGESPGSRDLTMHRRGNEDERREQDDLG
ncbi:MAG TPA: helix-turn-helix domain-containing protein [Solirubrobacterales bacterium]|nr:helix-turn-helix domain-containing protein [Solirubrobacterales bacterium]